MCQVAVLNGVIHSVTKQVVESLTLMIHSKLQKTQLCVAVLLWLLMELLFNFKIEQTILTTRFKVNITKYYRFVCNRVNIWGNCIFAYIQIYFQH